jgi:hypothetical protein
MEPSPETKPQKKLTFRAVLLGIITGLLLEILFILLAILLGKYESEAWDLYKDKLWWFATGILSFFLGRYVTSKVAGVQLKSIFKWEGEKDRSQ